VQVQRWLGHHSAAFTIDRYVHLLADDLGSAISLEDELADAGGKEVATDPTALPGSAGIAGAPNMPSALAISDSTALDGYTGTAS
jgi:hypothetical protein